MQLSWLYAVAEADSSGSRTPAWWLPVHPRDHRVTAAYKLKDKNIPKQLITFVVIF